MTMLLKIEEDVKNLPKDELNKFREWFQDYESKAWDKQMENDIKEDKLTALAESAISDFQNGKYKAI